MTYASVMVNLNPGKSNAAVLNVAGDLSERLHARVIGISAGQLSTNLYSDGYVAGSLIDQDRADLERLVQSAEAEFRHALHNRAERIEWRGAVSFASTVAYVTSEARSADLLVTGTGKEPAFSVNAGDLVMQAGRPVLAVPTGMPALNTGRVIVAWKDTREARRAAFDALPLLKLADKVMVVEIVVDDEKAGAERRTGDVVDWLGRHGIAATAIVSAPEGSEPDRLIAIVQEQEAGLIVAGAYGHNRLREWIIGGVTRVLLDDPDRCLLLSH
jgi:nucleotide-binding universal stress UspA family protein